MKEERNIITMDGQGNISLPSDIGATAMTERGNLRTVRGYRPDGSGRDKGTLQKRSFERI